MKKTILTLLVFFAALQLNAQTETLVGSNTKIGGFGGPLLQFASLNGEFAFYSGGGGAAIFDGRFYLGGFGMGLNTDHVYSYQDLPHYADIGFGGLWLGYIHKANKLVHLNFSLPVGGGGIEFSPINDDLDDPDYVDGFYMLNPSIGAELNVTSFMKISLNAGYMFFAGVDNDVLPASHLNSPSMMFALKFGYFAE